MDFPGMEFWIQRAHTVDHMCDAMVLKNLEILRYVLAPEIKTV